MKTKAKAGSLYKQKGSKFWWIKYYVRGNPRPIRESTETEDQDQAQQFLWKRLGEIATGKFVGLNPDRTRVGELLDLLEENYENNNRGSLAHLKSRIKNHLRPFFGDMKVNAVGTKQVSQYVARRKKEKAKNATINRELEHLRRAFKLGVENDPPLVAKPFKFSKLVEDNVREGLLEHDDYLKLRAGLPEPYKTLFVCAYHLGTREGELMKLQWWEVDFDRSEIVIKRYTTKTKKPRVLPIYGDMKAFLEAAKAVRDRLYPNCPWVFQRKGKRMVFVHKVWKNMVKRLGVEGLIFHDLRRTALTNMIEAGFSEKEAMEISGHKTDRTFRRYHIIRRHRIQTLGARMENHYKTIEGVQKTEPSTGREQAEKLNKIESPGIVPGIVKGSDLVQ